MQHAKIEQVTNWLESAVAEARTNKADPWGADNTAIEGLILTLREWSGAEMMGRTISMNVEDFVAAIRRREREVEVAR